MRCGKEERRGENITTGDVSFSGVGTRANPKSFPPSALGRVWRGAPDLERPSGTGRGKSKGLEILRVRVRVRVRVTEVRVRVR